MHQGYFVVLTVYVSAISSNDSLFPVVLK